jgi:hypothetical protein
VFQAQQFKPGRKQHRQYQQLQLGSTSDSLDPAMHGQHLSIPVSVDFLIKFIATKGIVAPRAYCVFSVASTYRKSGSMI